MKYDPLFFSQDLKMYNQENAYMHFLNIHNINIYLYNVYIYTYVDYTIPLYASGIGSLGMAPI